MTKKTEDSGMEDFCRLALYYTEQVGPRLASDLMKTFGSAAAVFKASLKQLLQIEGIGETRAQAIRSGNGKRYAEAELEFTTREQIRILFRENEAFPERLLHCPDAPLLLFHKGDFLLNRKRMIAVVGTRNLTEYGRKITTQLINELAGVPDLVVVSGLAAGIDTIAHKQSLQHQIPTVGVLGHGLHTIYPSANRQLARQMTEPGACLLTEFGRMIKVEKGNFPSRNRIIAGMCDVCVVTESDRTGGALITARIANSYSREVAAFPGRTDDPKSSGTNALIRDNRAALVTSAEDILKLMSWEQPAKTIKKAQQLMLHLSAEEQKLIDLLQDGTNRHADELLLLSGWDSSSLAGILLHLEMQGIIKTLPGKRYALS
ncbi:DNA-processing protein DprA [Rurimicrobium arvi]